MGVFQKRSLEALPEIKREWTKLEQTKKAKALGEERKENETRKQKLRPRLEYSQWTGVRSMLNTY